MPKDKTGAVRQQRYVERMRDAGFSRLSVWVPQSGRADFDAVVVKLQNDWAEQELYPDQQE